MLLAGPSHQYLALVNALSNRFISGFARAAGDGALGVLGEEPAVQDVLPALLIILSGVSQACCRGTASAAGHGGSGKAGSGGQGGDWGYVGVSGWFGSMLLCRGAHTSLPAWGVGHQRSCPEERRMCPPGGRGHRGCWGLLPPCDNSFLMGAAIPSWTIFK